MIPPAPRRVLVTGGAGFIGSHLVDALVARGQAVTVLDNLEPQVHPGGRPPSWLNPGARFVQGDVRDAALVTTLVREADAVFHLAAAVGVGQSQVEVRKYADVNVVGTATLLEALVKERHSVGKLIVAGSMSAYGEGLGRCAACGPVRPGSRQGADLEAGRFEPTCPRCRGPLTPLPTDEDQRLFPGSVYAITKRDQEQLALTVGRETGLPTVALRFFNTYGPRQSLTNPYNGVLAIFLGALLRGEAPQVFEDGLQTRDFVSVHDVVAAALLALDRPHADGRVVNVAAGSPRPLIDVARELATAVGIPIAPRLCGLWRLSDTRHCHPDLQRARALLGYAPRVGLAEGLREWTAWLRPGEVEP